MDDDDLESAKALNQRIVELTRNINEIERILATRTFEGEETTEPLRALRASEERLYRLLDDVRGPSGKRAGSKPASKDEAPNTAATAPLTGAPSTVAPSSGVGAPATEDVSQEHPVQPRDLVFRIPSGREFFVTQTEWDAIQLLLDSRFHEVNLDKGEQ